MSSAPVHYALSCVQFSGVEDAVLHALNHRFQFVLAPVCEPLPVLVDNVARLCCHFVPVHQSDLVALTRLLDWCQFYHIPRVVLAPSGALLNYLHRLPASAAGWTTELVLTCESWGQFDEFKRQLPRGLAVNQVSVLLRAGQTEDERWLAENVQFVHLSSTNCQTLSLSVQCWLQRDVTFVVDQETDIYMVGETHGNLIEFPDAIQTPLQPLGDNLDNLVYAVFERDRPKYAAYGAAVGAWLRHFEGKTECIRIVVAGAGRGGIVDAVLAVLDNSRLDVHVIVMEKNAFAADILKYRLEHETTWSTRVQEVVCADMRVHKFQQSIHLVVTELLGSFGCNEASPECISDFLTHHPAADSIPTAYTSFVAPVSCRDTWNSPAVEAHHMYLVNFARHLLLGKEKQVWQFDHDRNKPDARRQRYKQVTWTKEDLASTRAPVHGIAGYFEATLYGNVKIGNRKDDATKSWFPCFFPLQTPIEHLGANELVIEMQRKSEDARMWYEWRMYTDNTSNWNNENGHAYSVSLEA